MEGRKMESHKSPGWCNKESNCCIWDAFVNETHNQMQPEAIAMFQGDNCSTCQRCKVVHELRKLITKEFPDQTFLGDPEESYDMMHLEALLKFLREARDGAPKDPDIVIQASRILGMDIKTYRRPYKRLLMVNEFLERWNKPFKLYEDDKMLIFFLGAYFVPKQEGTNDKRKA